jgi:hypothetical protein
MLVAPMGHGGDHSAGKIRQSLTGLHEIQIMFWDDTEHPERLVKHLPMLSGCKKDGMKGVRLPQSEIDRRHFNGLRPSARNNRDCSFHFQAHNVNIDVFYTFSKWISYLARVKTQRLH